MRRLAFLSLLAAPVALGCSSSTSVDSVPERLGQGQQPIYYGKADNTHDAVVAILSTKAVNGQQGWACSGTIVAKNGNTGFVLTAAHCTDVAGDPPAYVVYGPDYAASKTGFQVTSYKTDPNYDAQSHAHDFGMVTISGVGAQTPTIPVMTPAQDNLKPGSQVTFVGYGKTENNPQNSKRFYVGGTLDQVDALLVGYGQQNGGPCEGDSGGPSLSTVGGQDVVSAVTSAGEATCMVSGISGRASAVWDTFINPYITGGAVGQQTCDQCFQSETSGQGACAGEVGACFNDGDCTALNDCLGKCAQGDAACPQACAAAHPTGLTLFNAIYTCVCDTGCKTECAAAAMCQQAPQAKCGFTANASCQACFEGACCAQGSACAADAVCATCFGNSPNAGCNNNALASAFESCLGQQCKSECGVGGGGGGGGQGGGGPINPGGGGSSPTGTGTGTGTDTGTGAGQGGAGGGAANGGGNAAKDAPTDGGLASPSSGCSVGGAPAGQSPLGSFALAALAVAGLLSRRRH